jgi:hypothetical protein
VCEQLEQPDSRKRPAFILDLLMTRDIVSMLVFDSDNTKRTDMNAGLQKMNAGLPSELELSNGGRMGLCRKSHKSGQTATGYFTSTSSIGCPSIILQEHVIVSGQLDVETPMQHLVLCTISAH